MQIMPASQTRASHGLFDMDNERGGDFVSAMEDALDSVQSGYHVSASTAMAEQQLVESPYSRQSDDGLTYTLSEVCFTKKELAELREQLLKEGAPEEALRQFDILADQPDGATLAQVLASLMVSGKTPQIPEEDAHSITALMNQIDPTGQLAGDVLAFLRQGSPGAAMDLIQEALGKMEPGELLVADKEGLLALGRALGLDAGALKNLAAPFGGASELRLGGEQFDALLNPAKNKLLSDKANADKIDAALEKTLKPIISRARDRMEKEKAAASLQDRRVEQSRVLIDRTVQKNARATMDEALAGGKAGTSGKTGTDEKTGAGEQAEAAKLAGESAEALMKQGAANARMSVEEAQQATKGQATEADIKKAARSESAIEAAKNVAAGAIGEAFHKENAESGLLNQEGKEKKESPWSDLLSRLEAKPRAKPATGASLVYSMIQGEASQLEPVLNLPNEPQLTARLANQVEQGLLTAMRDGSTRLDLELHPAELGAITLSLVSRDGEVTAQIRPDRRETAEMVARQVDAIRVNLEQQGIRVDKIEVQMQSKDNGQQNAFQDLGQHNARQEEDARRQELNRIRNLASLRNDRANPEDPALAQGLHNMARTAIYAGRALNVVA